MSEFTERAQKFLKGEQFSFEEANTLWKPLRTEGEFTLAWTVLERMRKDDGVHLTHGLTKNHQLLDELCRQQAFLISRDQELSAAPRHDRSLRVLNSRFDLDDPSLNQDSETLGIAAGIYKRRWEDLGRLDDLKRAAELYGRAAPNPLGDDAYVQINAAYLEDLLASIGNPATDLQQMTGNPIRQRIIDELPVSNTWWNAATRAEALLGLGRYSEAADVLRSASGKPDLWELQTTTRQLAGLARLRQTRPLDHPAIENVFEALLPGVPAATVSAVIGKVGLALSGGGFRASFYHLGVLARLAELDVLRHVEVLSCVSGGSVIGACYWLSLRRRLLKTPSMQHQDYVQLVAELVAAFTGSVASNLRKLTQPSKPTLAWRLIKSEYKQGVLSPEDVANALEEHFLANLWDADRMDGIFMDQLVFTPRDHNPAFSGAAAFNPGRHNWMRSNKVPSLILNATTVNTGRGWQFTPTWMGESPWAINEEADVIERLEWSPYSTTWRIRLARAVAASAAVPGIFSPLQLGPSYPNVDVQLVDGGVNDNQGVAALLASNCNIVLVSDACGQLKLEPSPKPGLKGFVSYANRAMDILMERVRQETFADLHAREASGALRGLLFLHLKAGLYSGTLRLPSSTETFSVENTVLSSSGVRSDFQRAIAELRTDLNAFTVTESHALMACGYQMASHGFQKCISGTLPELWEQPLKADWIFSDMLGEITSVAPSTPRRTAALEELRRGSRVVF